MEPLRPRPVPGPREYALQFEVRDPLAPYEVHRELLQALEAAGAEPADKPGPLEAVLAFPGLVEGEPWAASLAVEGAAGAVRARVRMRPQLVTEYTFWPPERLRAPLRAVLAARPCFAGSQRVPAQPAEVAPGQVAAFVRDALLAKDRALPAVVLTPGPWGSPEAARQLAADLIGVAAVVRLAAPEAAAELAPLVGGKERAVYGGAVRIYRPGFDPADDPLDHDLLIPRYIETRLVGGRSLAAELARRVLPMAGAPIPLPARLEPRPAARAAAPAARPEPPSPGATLARLEADLRQLRQENAELRDDVRRLREDLQTAVTSFEELEYLIPAFTDPALPWPVLNPRSRSAELAPSFAEQLAAVARDGSLAAEVKKKMEAVLLDPETYGKEMRGKRKGQRATYVARNYRLVWSMEGEKVRFVLIVSKEDPEYSPFGA